MCMCMCMRMCVCACTRACACVIVCMCAREKKETEYINVGERETFWTVYIVSWKLSVSERCERSR